MANPAPVIEYDEETDTAVYDANDIEYLIDTGVPIECPNCNERAYIENAVSAGCYERYCDRGPWSLEVRQDV